jgi:hypothetical protein
MVKRLSDDVSGIDHRLMRIAARTELADRLSAEPHRPKSQSTPQVAVQGGA